MTLATGVGSMPGGDPGATTDNARAYAEAVRVVIGELPDLPHVPELPGRGAGADLTGRTLGLVSDLAADLQPAGWRLTQATGVDQRRARSLHAQDLDQVEEQGQGLAAVKSQLCGPWTLAATVEKPRGDKVLSDHGARRELGEALAEAVGTHVADLRRRFPAARRLVVQVDEPALGLVLDGRVPTASGHGRHRAVHLPEAMDSLAGVLAAVTAAGAEPWLHSCASGIPWAEVRRCGAVGLSADLAVVGPGDLDVLAETLEAGGVVALGVVPSTEPPTAPTDQEVTERLLRLLDLVGLDVADVAERLVLTPACGLAGASEAWARTALGLVRSTARHLSG